MDSYEKIRNDIFLHQSACNKEVAEVTKKAMGWGRAANIFIRLMDRTESYLTQQHNMVGGNLEYCNHIFGDMHI